MTKPGGRRSGFGDDVSRFTDRRLRAGGLMLVAVVCVLVLVPKSANGQPPAVLLPGLENAQLLTLSNPQIDTNVVPEPSYTNHRFKVSVGLYVLNLVGLDEVQQTFSCTAYLTETWTDVRLAFTAKPGEPSRRYYRKDAIWFPLLQLDNSTAPRTLSGYLLTGDSGGTVRYTEKFSVRLSTNMYLRAFPFDAQDLEVYVHPFINQNASILLTVDPRSTGVSSTSYTPLPLWNTTGSIKYASLTGYAGNVVEAVSHVVFRIHVVRHSEYYVFRIFLPLLLMVAISWGVLWTPPGDLSSQLTISVTTVLTLVAFSVAVSNVLPPVPYLTFYDSFFLVSFFFILLTTAEAILIHTANGRDRATALRLRRLTRCLFPSLYLLAVALVAFIFLL